MSTKCSLKSLPERIFSTKETYNSSKAEIERGASVYIPKKMIHAKGRW